MSVEADKKLERVKRIIRELQNKTESNGCTEQEAMAAAATMGRLLEENNLDITEIGVREETSKCEKFEVYAADDYAGSLIVGIKHFCEIIAYTVSNEGHAGKYVFFGTPHDVAIALYLYEVCAEAMEHDWARYMETNGYSMKKRMSFRAGFSRRIYDRLMEMKRERDAASASTCRDLVVLKDQLVTEEFARRFGIKLVTRRGGGNMSADMSAYRAGQSAGGRVNLRNPIEGGVGSSERLG
jgi:hypothetical protein